jgi:hypothetical protein
MALYQNMNQFSMTALKGKIAAGPNGNTISVQLYAGSVATLYPGDFVTLIDATATTIIVEKAAVTDGNLMCVLASPKKDSFTALDVFEVALPGSIVNLESAAAIVRGADVEFVISGIKVQTSAGTSTIVGVALDKASGSGKLVRILLKGTLAMTATFTSGTINAMAIGGITPAAGAFTSLSNTLGITGPNTAYGVFTKRSRLTTSAMNAGATLVAAVAGKKLRLIDCKIIAYGGNAAATANATAIAITGTQTTGVALFTVALAQLTRSAVNRVGTASTTVLADGASFVANDAATALTVAPVGGTDLITATGFDVEVTYAIEA